MKEISRIICFLLLQSLSSNILAQETALLPAKVHHAEPLYSDLARDLGARKGEKEWNVGAEYYKNSQERENGFLLEYEFAPFNRIGMEVEADFTFYNVSPKNKLEGLRFSSQYSFFVSPKAQTTLAAGYTQILHLTEFNHYGQEALVNGTAYNPFFIAAKKWGKRINTLVYLSPIFHQHFAHHSLEFHGQVNSSLLYELDGAVRFVGVEINQDYHKGKMYTVVRPQVKIRVNHKTSIGFVGGIPGYQSGQKLDIFARLIYEP